MHEFRAPTGQRTALAGALAEASALAGWLALDRDDHDQAWRHHERAKHAAREADSPVLLAHATAQEAFILVGLNDADSAATQVAHARALADGGPALMSAWLAAAHGETLAASGNRDDALRPSTMPKRSSRTIRSTRHSRSCSSADPTSTDGAATPSRKSATPKRSTN